MKQLFRLALTADVVALVTLTLGSWTRINGAGLTCPDWPLCRGHVIPWLGGGTLWEWAHRLLAFSVAPLLLALIAVGWRERRRSAFLAPALATIAGLFLVQVVLGAETVALANAPISVVLHWATAMALIAALTAIAVFAAAREGEARPAVTAASSVVTLALGASAIAAFVTMCIGAYVSSSGAGLACLSIPGCAGNVVVYTPGEYVQMLHRIAAGVTLVCAAVSLSVSWAYSASARVRGAAVAGASLVCVQVLLGLLNVALRLPTNLREAHAVNAAFVFLAFFVAAIFAIFDAPAPRREFAGDEIASR